MFIKKGKMNLHVEIYKKVAKCGECVMDKIKIIIADDNIEFLNILNEYLSSQIDFEVVAIANDGREVLEVFKEEKADLLILDILMPEFDGIKVLEKINEMEIRPVKRIIIVSTMGHENITNKAIFLGADYYIVKPFNMSILVDRIRQLFKHDNNI
jgi:Response regulator containing a CheY-like receiver domain and an HTH DNA-binding domain